MLYASRQSNWVTESACEGDGKRWLSPFGFSVVQMVCSLPLLKQTWACSAFRQAGCHWSAAEGRLGVFSGGCASSAASAMIPGLVKVKAPMHRRLCEMQ